MYTVLLSIYQKEQPKCLKQSLDSIFNQTIFPSEVVLVKDGHFKHRLTLITMKEGQLMHFSTD